MTTLVYLVHRLKKVRETVEYLFSVNRNLVFARGPPVIDPLLGKVDGSWGDIGDIHRLEAYVLALGAKKREARQPLTENVDRERLTLLVRQTANLVEIIDVEITAGAKRIPAKGEQALPLRYVQEDKPADHRIEVAECLPGVQKIGVDVVHLVLEPTASREIDRDSVCILLELDRGHLAAGLVGEITCGAADSRAHVEHPAGRL